MCFFKFRRTEPCLWDPGTQPTSLPTSKNTLLSVENPGVAVDTDFSKRQEPTVRGWDGSLNPGAELLQQLRSTVEENAQ